MSKATSRLSAAQYVERGYGQVEDNKLSAKYNGKIFAQLPCQKDIKVVENGMFLCYDYPHKVVVKPTVGGMEPMLVFNEVKVYDGFETDADFAMIDNRYEARVYNATAGGVSKHVLPMPGAAKDRTLTEYDNVSSLQSKDSKEMNPYGMMRIAAVEGKAVDSAIESNSIVPRLFKTDVGDIFTTNCIDEEGTLQIGDTLKVDTSTGYLKKEGDYEGMEWTVVNVYNMPDLQKGVKIMRTK